MLHVYSVVLSLLLWCNFGIHFTYKWKAEQRDNRAAGSFNPTSYTRDDGQLGQNM
jgi:hypothetical protein